MHRLKLLQTIAFLIFCGVSAAVAATPAAPSDLKVKALGVNAFQLTWKDNSNDELGWEIRLALAGNPPQRYTLFPVPNATSYLLFINELPGKELDFQVAAYNGVAGLEKISARSATVSADTFSSSSFGAPTKLKVTALDDGRFQLRWKDNSTSENGYQIEFKQAGSKKWLPPIGLNPGIKFKQIISGFPPGTRYSFRVRALKGNPVKFTSYSKVVTTSTQEFLAPSELVATPQGEGEFVFRWKDRSSSESGFELQRRIGGGDFQSLGTIDANDTFTIPITGFAMDTDHEFRLRCFLDTAAGRVFSDFSNVSAVRSTPLKAPTALAATTTTADTVTLTWTDQSAREFGYEILTTELDSSNPRTGSAGQNAQTGSVSGLKPGTDYLIRVRAYDLFSGATSAYTAQLAARTREGILGNFNPLIVSGSQFLYDIQLTRPDLISALTVTNLPAGLTFNAATRTITGTVSTGGPYTAIISATFNDGSTNTRNLVLKLTPPAPAIVAPFAAVNLPVAANRVVSLSGKFSDPDTASAARVSTTLGAFDIIFFPIEAPATVDNFLDYVDANKFDSSFFHRAPANFVVQGGGYLHTPAAGYSRVVTFPPVVNEPGLSNVRGTVAMAKLGGDPNSATSQWFVNVNDNSVNLDAQNGGFTVFGRVPTSGMTVVDAISALPRNTYTIPIGAGNDTLDNVPVNTTPPAPAVLDPAQLVKISSVTAAPILTYSVLSADTAIATASLSGTDITVTGVASGSTTIAVTATDLDGNTTSQNIAVTVP